MKAGVFAVAMLQARRSLTYPQPSSCPSVSARRVDLTYALLCPRWRSIRPAWIIDSVRLGRHHRQEYFAPSGRRYTLPPLANRGGRSAVRRPTRSILKDFTPSAWHRPMASSSPTQLSAEQRMKSSSVRAQSGHGALGDFRHRQLMHISRDSRSCGPASTCCTRLTRDSALDSAVMCGQGRWQSYCVRDHPSMTRAQVKLIGITTATGMFNLWFAGMQGFAYSSPSCILADWISPRPAGCRIIVSAQAAYCRR